MSKTEKLQPEASVGERARNINTLYDCLYPEKISRECFAKLVNEIVISREFEQDGRMRECLQRVSDRLNVYHNGADTCEDSDCEGCKNVREAERLLRGE